MRTARRSSDATVVVGILVLAVRVVATAMLVPATFALLSGDVNSASALVLGAAVPHLLLVPLGSRVRLRARPTWQQAFAAAGAAWPVCALVAAVPLALSPHYRSTLDAFVEALAGLTTTGFTLVQDLDHLPVALNLWRHGLHVLGAVGVLVAVGVLRVRGRGTTAPGNVVSAGRDHVLPSQRRALEDAVRLVAAWSALGVVLLTVVGTAVGLSPGRALLHAATLATSAFATGGFTLTSQSAGALHSAAAQVVLAVLMLAGATSLVLHRTAWSGRLRRPQSELDVRVLGLAGGVLSVAVLVGLARAGAHEGPVELARQGLFTLVAAQTTTGFTPGAGRLVATGWGELAPAVLVVAMGVGGMAGSLSGGLGTLRAGVLAKSVAQDVRRLLLPENALVVSTYHQERRRVLGDDQVRAAGTMLLLLVLSILAGSVLDLALTDDLRLTEVLFSATSAVTTTGIGIGVVGPATPTPAVLSTGLLMWLGRVEFLAALAAVGMFARAVPMRGARR